MDVYIIPYSCEEIGFYKYRVVFPLTHLSDLTVYVTLGVIKR